MADTFLERNRISLGKTLVADGTAEVLTAVEDMSGFDEITFLVLHGDVDDPDAVPGPKHVCQTVRVSLDLWHLAGPSPDDQQ